MLFEIIMPGSLQFHLVIQKQSLLCSQMEQIISEGLRMENALSHFFFFLDWELIWGSFDMSVGYFSHFAD